jgi:chemotaxis protein MotB
VPRKGSRSHHDEEHEEHVNHEAWVIPYADMLTLLMGLFLVLWAIGNQDLAKMKQFAQSFSAEVGISSPVASGGTGVLEGGSGTRSTETTLPPPLGPTQLRDARAALDREAAVADAVAADEAQLTQAETVIRDRAAAAGVADAITFRREDRGLVVSIVSDDVLFGPGSADLQADGTLALDALAGALVALPNQISIEGHTDDVPISNARFPSNWELSTSRAGVVLRYLVDRHGLDPSHVVAGGYADQRPLESNETAEGRARNRRVDIAVLSTVEADAPAGVSTDEGTPAADAAPHHEKGTP